MRLLKASRLGVIGRDSDRAADGGKTNQRRVQRSAGVPAAGFLGLVRAGDGGLRFAFDQALIEQVACVLSF